MSSLREASFDLAERERTPKRTSQEEMGHLSLILSILTSKLISRLKKNHQLSNRPEREVYIGLWCAVCLRGDLCQGAGTVTGPKDSAPQACTPTPLRPRRPSHIREGQQLRCPLPITRPTPQRCGRQNRRPKTHELKTHDPIPK